MTVRKSVLFVSGILHHYFADQLKDAVRFRFGCRCSSNVVKGISSKIHISV